MWKTWFPWRWIVRKVAQKQGFLDPVAVLSKLQRFAQPSEVAAPIELIRLATVLQARGLINVQAIQHNLDWVWPYWVVRQFNPRDPSFIPRAFSLTHINLTHRNWTAVGVPDCPHYPLADPRGLVTPFYDGWSLDAWVIHKKGEDLLPSRAPHASQYWAPETSPCLETETKDGRARIVSCVTVESFQGKLFTNLKFEAQSEEQAWLAVSVRPFNAEGVCEVEQIAWHSEGFWEINQKQKVFFSALPEAVYFSEYHEGDVYQKIQRNRTLPANSIADNTMKCKAGMATGAVLFPLTPGASRQIEFKIPFDGQSLPPEQVKDEAPQIWEDALENHCRLSIGDKQVSYLYENAVKTLVLHAPDHEVFPGPYTYKHFWFRDACFIVHALLAAHLPKRAEKILDHFPERQSLTGHFKSQDGEWDSNGQVLWIYRRFCELTGAAPKTIWKESIRTGTTWIQKKRTAEDLDAPHAGLFPAGFSAEHLGPNDFYYWDDFWGVEGFRSAAFLMEAYGEKEEAHHFRENAANFLKAIEKSLAYCAKRLHTLAMPSSPYRRLDTGSIGSLAVGYPLDFWEPQDPRVMETVEYLLENSFINGGFFHDMSHSGINPYLTLAVAQILLRNNDPRALELLHGVQKCATSSGQWPEAIHPQTMGGCMGDGQHVWAAAEWVLMIRNCFVREEKDQLILGSGIAPQWLKAGEIKFGPAPTSFGTIHLEMRLEGQGLNISWKAEWRKNAPAIEIRVPGYALHKVQAGETSVLLKAGKA